MSMELGKDTLPIPGLPGYFATSNGQIVSCKPGQGNRFKEPRTLSSWVSEGYHHVTLYIAKDQRKRFPVHRLVARAFIGECPTGSIVRHLNGDPGDNRLTNLSYSTQKQNILDKHLHGTMVQGEDHFRTIISDDDCLEMLGMIRCGIPQVKIARQFNVSQSHVSALKKGRIRKYLTK